MVIWGLDNYKANMDIEMSSPAVCECPKIWDEAAGSPPATPTLMAIPILKNPSL